MFLFVLKSKFWCFASCARLITSTTSKSGPEDCEVESMGTRCLCACRLRGILIRKVCAQKSGLSYECVLMLLAR